MPGPFEKRRDPADRFVLRTLGGASLSVVHQDGTSEIILRPSKPARGRHLSLAPDHSASRASLVDLLWFHRDRPQALSGLRVALNTLR
jgi:DNA-binding SARP family transcriptional activator